jgi:hypothetical protein
MGGSRRHATSHSSCSGDPLPGADILIWTYWFAGVLRPAMYHASRTSHKVALYNQAQMLHDVLNLNGALFETGSVQLASFSVGLGFFDFVVDM